MSGEWASMRLGDAIELKRGYDLPSTQRVPGSFPVISSSGRSGTHEAAMAKAPGVVTGRYGTLGGVHYVTQDFWPLNTTLYVSNFKGSEPRFVAYFLKTLDFYAYSDKAAVPGLNRNDLHTAEIVWPSRGDQTAIAHILGAVDDKIELNRRMAGTLEAMARALFQSWFVDFDPVRARAVGHMPAFMDEATATLFPDRLGADGLPDGWQMKRLGDFARLNYGKALTKEQRKAGPFPVFGSGGSESSHSEALVSEPTIIVGRKGTVGSIHWAPRGCWPIDTTYYVTSDYPLSFLIEVLGHLPLRSMNTDAAVPGLNRENAYRLDMPDAGRDIIEAFSQTTDLWRQRIDALTEEADILAALRDALLPKLISGELRVRDASEASAA